MSDYQSRGEIGCARTEHKLHTSVNLRARALRVECRHPMSRAPHAGGRSRLVTSIRSAVEGEMYRIGLVTLVALLLGGAALARGSYISQVSSHPDLVASWRLGESGGATAAEVKGVSPGTYTNFSDPADYGRPGAIAGDPNTAAYFDGSNNYV